jgi:hypothetical protein
VRKAENLPPSSADVTESGKFGFHNKRALTARYGLSPYITQIRFFFIWLSLVLSIETLVLTLGGNILMIMFGPKKGKVTCN